MYIKKECVAMLLAGGQGSRLYALTQDMAKPAVPYGGKYRIIDFPLSNCTNSGIDTVGGFMGEFMFFLRIRPRWELRGTRVRRTLFTRI